MESLHKFYTYIIEKTFSYKTLPQLSQEHLHQSLIFPWGYLFSGSKSGSKQYMYHAQIVRGEQVKGVAIVEQSPHSANQPGGRVSEQFPQSKINHRSKCVSLYI